MRGRAFLSHHRTVMLAFVVLLLLAAFAGALTACGEEEASTSGDEGTPKPGGTFNFPLDSNPPGIDAVGFQESEGWKVVHQIYEGLVAYELDEDGGMQAVPDIAESWESNEDASVWTFKLKQGVTFHSPVSREVVAQDFVDSWNRATDPKNGSYTSYILAPIQGADDGGYWDSDAGLTGVKAIDDSTLEVTLRYPFAEFVQTLGHPIASATPVDYINEIGAKAYNRKPVGTGPFMVKEWKNNRYIDLVKNPDYWDTENAAYLDAIHLPVIVDSPTRWMEFQKGGLDVTDVPPGQVEVAKNMPQSSSGEWTAKAWPSLTVEYVGINMKNPSLGGDQSLELRKALALSADAENVISVVMENVPAPATGIVPEGIPGYVPDQSPYLYDPEAAKEIVAGLGEVPDLTYWYNTDEAGQKASEVLQAGWTDLGFTVKLENFEWGTYLDKLAKSVKGDEGSSQLFRMGWIADYPTMDNFLYPLFHSSQSATMYTFYDSPEFDDLVVSARQTTDQAQRWDLYHQAERLMLADAPCIPLYYHRTFRVNNNRIVGFAIDPMQQVDTWKLWVK